MGKTFGKIAVVGALGYLAGDTLSPKKRQRDSCKISKLKADEAKAKADVKLEQVKQASKDGADCLQEDC